MQILTTSSMDFLSYLRQEMQAPPTKVYCNHEDHKEDDDDDVFYDELRRQVFQLTDEDDDHADVVTPTTITEVRIHNGPCNAPRPGGYYDWAGPGMKDCGGAPSWMLNLWRSGNNNNGTGVFIPQTVHSARRYRSSMYSFFNQTIM